MTFFLSKIRPMIREKHIPFSFELREKVLKNNKNSVKIQGKLKHKTAVNPESWDHPLTLSRQRSLPYRN